MFEESRIDIYNYLHNLFYGVVTNNIYFVNEPQELTENDRKDGFLVIRVGDLHDESEFTKQTYGWTRVYLEAYIPPKSRGRIDANRYKFFEDSINEILTREEQSHGGDYSIDLQNVLSYDTDNTQNANNQFFLFIKSFNIYIDKQ